ncbi:unnamed protein product [Anisakis simplex]|uniref:Cadherin domain-containing protein n=1 Tax=Anisakis simplex TaxID=6269 RepID=A0A0M3JJ77_ANISI|nr:unnamed protein product [Anisakis simplex]
MNNPLLDNECIQSSAVSSLPPTARHTPFRYSVEFDDNQHFINTNLIANPSDVTTVAIPSSSSAASFQAHYSLAVIPPATTVRVSSFAQFDQLDQRVISVVG